jgi:hypothetical protein
MAETVDVQVLAVVPPEEHADAEMLPELRDLAESRYVLVCRKGGAPSWFERIWAVLRRRPIEAVTLVADGHVSEGTEVRATVEETAMVDVYEVQAFE